MIYIPINFLSLKLIGINLSLLIDLSIFVWFLFGLNINKNNYFKFFNTGVLLLIYIFRMFFSIEHFDWKYVYVSFKLLFFLFIFLGFKGDEKAFNGENDKIKQLFLLSCLLFLVDKLVGYFTQGLLYRPVLMVETNFDMVFVTELWLILKLSKEKLTYKIDLLFYLILVISLSRSAFIAVAFASTLLYLMKHKTSFKLILKLLLLCSFFILILGVLFYLRDPTLDINKVDRVQLLTALIDSYNENPVFLILFGHGVNFPLPQNVCNMFSELALSITGDIGSCNPVILTSYFVRCLYEYGLIVTFLVPIFYFLYFKSKSNTIISFILISPVLFASFSVGGFYNSIAILSLLLASRFTNINNFKLNIKSSVD